MKHVAIGDCDIACVDRGEGQPLLLVHGFPLSHAMWDAQVDAFAASHRVIAPDLRGFGESSPLDSAAMEPDAQQANTAHQPALPQPLTMQRLADDLAALLAALEVDEPVVYCGLSMGGYLAWQFWRKHAARLRALILCDTRAAADTQEAKDGRRAMAQRVLREGSQIAADAMLPKLFAETTRNDRPQIVESVRQTILATSPRTIAAAQLGMAERPDMTRELPAVGVPTLLLCGQFDAISPPEEMRTIAEAMPRSQFCQIAGAGHMAPMEAPAAVNDAIREFLVAITA